MFMSTENGGCESCQTAPFCKTIYLTLYLLLLAVLVAPLLFNPPH